MNARTQWTPILAAMSAAFCWCCGAALESCSADTFSFSSAAAKAQEKDQADAANQAQTIRGLVSVPCQQRLKNRRILLLIGERTGTQWRASQDRYEPLLRVIE